ncbi:tyrosine-type recombinase/integrase [Fulvivirga sp. M361]|uniref:site-specific tyrosine recombinase/integron integrase n=1 Tax=Fulvivirga sp. M361 TaxID=2594266 RepID=UPI001179F2DA|nr:site-specific tyrosine recombinase/integron integrase [Fulvivirga sp. M361]TRX55512.1 tyrosine-type recombinase/integrase [Fulvivirga sp. M361]
MDHLQFYQSELLAFNHTLSAHRYSESTCRIYVTMFREFLNYLYPRRLHSINGQDIVRFQSALITRKKISRSYQNQSINAIKFYFEKVLHCKKQRFKLERPKKENTLPVILSKKEVARVISCIKSIKHRAIISTIYGTGLRISELQHLKIEDIDSDHRRIWIRSGKGNKDRATLLPDNLLMLLRAYYRKHRPEKFLFEGPDGGIYSASSIRKILKRACFKAGVRKKVTPHTLRHSFATHLMESGVNLRYIQTLLGHTSSKTTEIYTHLCNQHISEIRSPLSMLEDLSTFER